MEGRPPVRFAHPDNAGTPVVVGATRESADRRPDVDGYRLHRRWDSGGYHASGTTEEVPAQGPARATIAAEESKGQDGV